MNAKNKKGFISLFKKVINLHYWMGVISILVPNALERKVRHSPLIVNNKVRCFPISWRRLTQI